MYEAVARSKVFLLVRRQLPHIPKHRRAMIGKTRNIGRVGLAHGEQ